MSVRIMGAIWGLELEPTTAHILLALADHADHNGDHARPGVDLLKWKTGYSDRQVRRVLAELIDMGVLVPTAGVGGGRGKHTEYSIVLDHVPNRPEPGPRRNADKKTANRAGFQGPRNPANVAGYSTQNPAIHDTETLPSTTQNPAIHDMKTGGTPFNLTVKEPSIRTTTLTPLPPSNSIAILPPELTADEQAIRDHRDRLMDAYFDGVGIAPDSPERLARRYQAGNLTREIVCRLDTATMRGMADYTRRDWLSARPKPIRAIPSVDHVLKKHTEYLEAASGTPPASVPDGRRGMGNDFLANLARGQK